MPPTFQKKPRNKAKTVARAFYIYGGFFQRGSPRGGSCHKIKKDKRTGSEQNTILYLTGGKDIDTNRSKGRSK